MKQTRFIFIVLIMICGFTAQAQRNRRAFPDVNEMRERKWKLLSEQAKLTPEEMDVVKPVFLEYEQAVWKIHQERRGLMMELRAKTNKNEVDYASMNDKYINFELKQAQLLRDYHLKLKSLLKPESLFNFYRAENIFKRKLLRNMPPPPNSEEVKK